MLQDFQISDPAAHPKLRRLVTNADDFGLTEGVNRAIGELADAGVLTSATLMANGAAFDHAVAVAKSRPSLGVGCHVVLVDGMPVLPPEQVPSLVTPRGRLGDSLLRFAADLQRGLIAEKEIEAEAVAQITRLQAAGIAVTHVDTHKHTHLFPRVARPLMRAAMRCGVRAIRNPFEPAWSARLTRGALVRRVEVAALRRFQHSFHQVLRASGLHTTRGCIGVSATGHLDAAALQRLLHDAPPGTWELVCHPGYNDEALRAVKTRLRETRETEREAIGSLIPAAVESGTVQLLRFDQL